MANHPKIVDLDISWNKFTTGNLLKFVEELEEDNRLKSLNISWNSLKSPIEPGDLQAHCLQSHKRGSVVIKHNPKSKKPQISTADLVVTQTLYSYIKHSTKL